VGWNKVLLAGGVTANDLNPSGTGFLKKVGEQVHWSGIQEGGETTFSRLGFNILNYTNSSHNAFTETVPIEKIESYSWAYTDLAGNSLSSTVVKVTSTNHGLSSGDLVSIYGITGTYGLNNSWVVEALDEANIANADYFFLKPYTSIYGDDLHETLSVVSFPVDTDGNLLADITTSAGNYVKGEWLFSSDDISLIGTNNRISLSEDSNLSGASKQIRLDLPQDLHTEAILTFNDLTLTSLETGSLNITGGELSLDDSIITTADMKIGAIQENASNGIKFNYLHQESSTVTNGTFGARLSLDVRQHVFLDTTEDVPDIYSGNNLKALSSPYATTGTTYAGVTPNISQSYLHLNIEGDGNETNTTWNMHSTSRVGIALGSADTNSLALVSKANGNMFISSYDTASTAAYPTATAKGKLHITATGGFSASIHPGYDEGTIIKGIWLKSDREFNVAGTLNLRRYSSSYPGAIRMYQASSSSKWVGIQPTIGIITNWTLKLPIESAPNVGDILKCTSRSNSITSVGWASGGADGADGSGWTGGSYDSNSGIATFTSTDGLGFSTTDLRGADGATGATGAAGSDANVTSGNVGAVLAAGTNISVAEATAEIATTNSIVFTQKTIIYSSTTTTADWSLGNKATITLTGNISTFAFTNPTNPCNLLLKIVQDGTGSRTISAWDTDIKWSGGGTAPTLSTGAGAVDIISFYFDGTNYYGAASLDFS